MVVGAPTPQERHGDPLLPAHTEPEIGRELAPLRDRASLIDALLAILVDTSRPVEDRVESLVTVHIANLLGPGVPEAGAAWRALRAVAHSPDTPVELLSSVLQTMSRLYGGPDASPVGGREVRDLVVAFGHQIADEPVRFGLMLIVFATAADRSDPDLQLWAIDTLDRFVAVEAADPHTHLYALGRLARYPLPEAVVRLRRHARSSNPRLATQASEELFHQEAKHLREAVLDTDDTRSVTVATLARLVHYRQFGPIADLAARGRVNADGIRYLHRLTEHDGATRLARKAIRRMKATLGQAPLTTA
jgi:hypothetical protein